MRPAFIVLADPLIYVNLQLLQIPVQRLPKGNAVELVLHGSVKPLANAVGLRVSCLGTGMIDILHRQIQLIFMVLAMAAVLGSAVGEDAQ